MARERAEMNRRIKEFVDIGEHVSLNDLIEQLVELRCLLPEGSEAELKLRGDDVFGRKITIAYMRELTEDEAEMERRYTEASREAKVLQLERLQAELGLNDDTAPAGPPALRMVA
jgi:thermostable 8-oxoguanine DNA glycosylase